MFCKILKNPATLVSASISSLILLQSRTMVIIGNLSVIALGALEGLLHLRFSNLIRKSLGSVGALGRTGARLAGLVLMAEAHNLRLVMKGAFWMSGACLLGLVCATT